MEYVYHILSLKISIYHCGNRIGKKETMSVLDSKEKLFSEYSTVVAHMYEFIAVGTACPRPVQAQAQWNPTIEGRGGHKTLILVGELLAIGSCWKTMSCHSLMVNNYSPGNGPTMKSIYIIQIGLSGLKRRKDKKWCGWEGEDESGMSWEKNVNMIRDMAYEILKELIKLF